MECEKMTISAYEWTSFADKGRDLVKWSVYQELGCVSIVNQVCKSLDQAQGWAKDSKAKGPPSENPPLHNVCVASLNIFIS